jgi:glycerol-3-phosphate dehydrogenase
VDAPAFLEVAQPGELEPIAGTQILWAELRWAARSEGVVHLDDLMLRRTRLGLLLPKGGVTLLPNIRAICQPELGWDDVEWEAEEAEYLALWKKYYSLPIQEMVPDWRKLLANARMKREAERPVRRQKILKGSALAGILATLAFVLAILFWRRRKTTKA